MEGGRDDPNIASGKNNCYHDGNGECRKPGFFSGSEVLMLIIIFC